MYYIRFLKPPRVQRDTSGCFFMKTLLTITTDLGDRFYPLDTKLSVFTNSDSDSHHEELVTWKAGMRTLSISPKVLKTTSRDAVLGVNPTTRSTAIEKEGQLVMPPILGASSRLVEIKEGAEAAKELDRTIRYSRVHSVVEELGDSMTNHLWDSSVCLAVYLEHLMDGKFENHLPTLKQVLHSKPSKGHRIIELGCGCGVVGIMLSWILDWEKCDIILTDLADAKHFATRNINHGSPLLEDIYKMFPVRFEPLDWAAGELPDSVKEAPFDLVIAADVTYNTDTMPMLVATLSKLSELSNGMPIVIATKIRHVSENIFFDRMEAENFFVKEKCTILAPATDEDIAEVEEPEKIHVYVFQRR